MPNAEKERIVSELREIVAHSKGAILTDYRGLTVAEVTNLRRKLRDVDAEYHIVKNTLFKIAVGDGLSPEVENLLTGPTAIAFAHNDVVAPAKAVLDFLRDLKKPEIKVKGGWIDGKVYSVEQVTTLSKLPPREQIVAQLIGTLNAPLSELVGTLDNIIGEFVRTVQAIVDKRQEGGEPEVAAPATAQAASSVDETAPPAEAPVAAVPTAEAAIPPAEASTAPVAATEEAAPAAPVETPAEASSADSGEAAGETVNEAAGSSTEEAAAPVEETPAEEPSAPEPASGPEESPAE